MAVGIVMPKAGNSVEECILSKWRIKEGDTIKKGDIIADAETDKTEIEIEATADGTVLKLFWEPGAIIPVLVNICAVGTPGEDASALAPSGAAAPAADAPKAEAAPAPEAPKAEAPAPAAAPTPTPAPTGDAANNAPMSPRAKMFLAEHPFIVPAIQGSGANGRIIAADVEAAYQNSPRLSPTAAAIVGTGLNGMVLAADLAAAAAPAPAAPAAPAAAPAAAADTITEKPFSNIRKVIAKRLLESLTGMAQYTLNAEADVSGLLALRAKIKAQSEKLGLANINIGDMVMYAVIKALQIHPEMNGEYANNVVKLHSAVHIGFACDTPKGLLVPVLHNSDTMTLAEMCRTVKAMAKQAKDGNLPPDDMNGATFTVSNLGSFGITTFTPVISAPQLAMLGVGKTVLRPIRTASGEIVFKDYMQLSLTMNHMVIDGAQGARFLQTLKDLIENFELICIAK